MQYTWCSLKSLWEQGVQGANWQKSLKVCTGRGHRVDINDHRRVTAKNVVQFQYTTAHNLRSEADPSPIFESIKIKNSLAEHLCPLGFLSTQISIESDTHMYG